MNARAIAERFTPLCGRCTSMKFFAPMPAFYGAMQPFFGLDVIDVGAGQGHVVEGLRLHGHDAIGIDIRTDGAPFRVFQANAVTFSYPPGSVAMFCRPCHGDYFVEPAIQRMIECDVRAIIYVGLMKNVTSDLGTFRRRFRRAAMKVGVDGEAFYLFDRRPST